MGTIREGRWDCKTCGRKGNLGSEKICPGCGKPRGQNVKFYLPEDTPALTDQEQIRKANLGPDWNCEHCGSANQADKHSCTQCGAPKGSSPSNPVKEYVRPQPLKAPTPTDRTTHSSRDHEEELTSMAKATRHQQINQPRPGSDYESHSTPFPRKKVLIFGSLGLGIILIGVITLLMLHTKDVPLKLVGVTWTREIAIEKYKTVVEEDWDIPSGGREKSSRRKVHHTEKVFDHNETKHRTVRVQVGTDTETYTCGQIDKGNGYFEEKTCTRSIPRYEDRDETYQEAVYRDDPVYRTWYTYEIERWKYERSVSASGIDQNVFWPDYTLADPRFSQLDKERAGARSEIYETTFFGGPDEKSYNLKVDYNRWSHFKVGQTYTGKMNVFGMLLDIKDPE